MVMVDSTAQPLARGGTRASVSQAQIEAEAAAIRALLAANKIANAGRGLFPWRKTDIVAPPENMEPFEARAVKLADPSSGLESVYQTLASERWRKQQEDLERRLAGIFLESTFIDQNNPKRQTAGPRRGSPKLDLLGNEPMIRCIRV